MIVTKHSLDQMGLCGNHWAQLAYRFVGKDREITFGSVVLALEQGADVNFFLDYWLRENAGAKRHIKDTGPITGTCLEIYEELYESLGEIRKEGWNRRLQLGFRQARHTEMSARAELYLNALESLWFFRRWAI